MRLPTISRVRQRPRKRNWVVSTVEAVVAAVTVCVMVWYALARTEELDEQMAGAGPTWAGLITVVIVLSAGGLLAFAFGRAEDAVRGRRAAADTQAEADE